MLPFLSVFLHQIWKRIYKTCGIVCRRPNPKVKRGSNCTFARINWSVRWFVFWGFVLFFITVNVLFRSNVRMKMILPFGQHASSVLCVLMIKLHLQNASHPKSFDKQCNTGQRAGSKCCLRGCEWKNKTKKTNQKIVFLRVLCLSLLLVLWWNQMRQEKEKSQALQVYYYYFFFFLFAWSAQ